MSAVWVLSRNSAHAANWPLGFLMDGCCLFMRLCHFDDDEDDDDYDDDDDDGPQCLGCKPIFTLRRLAFTLASHNGE